MRRALPATLLLAAVLVRGAAGADAPQDESTLQSFPPATGEPPSLEAAFGSCVALPRQALAAALMRAVDDAGARAALSSDQGDRIGAVALERHGRYLTLTAQLKSERHPELKVAGLAPHTIYAAGCEGGCALELWGLDFGRLQAQESESLHRWAEAAARANVHHGDTQVQVNTTSEGSTVLVCDLSG